MAENVSEESFWENLQRVPNLIELAGVDATDYERAWYPDDVLKFLKASSEHIAAGLDGASVLCSIAFGMLERSVARNVAELATQMTGDEQVRTEKVVQALRALAVESLTVEDFFSIIGSLPKARSRQEEFQATQNLVRALVVDPEAGYDQASLSQAAKLIDLFKAGEALGPRHCGNQLHAIRVEDFVAALRESFADPENVEARVELAKKRDATEVPIVLARFVPMYWTKQDRLMQGAETWVHISETVHALRSAIYGSQVTVADLQPFVDAASGTGILANVGDQPWEQQRALRNLCLALFEFDRAPSQQTAESIGEAANAAFRLRPVSQRKPTLSSRSQSNFAAIASGWLQEVNIIGSGQVPRPVVSR